MSYRLKVKAIAARVRRIEASKSATALLSVLGTPLASTVLEQLVAAWRNIDVDSNELASSYLLSATFTSEQLLSNPADSYGLVG